MVLQRSAALVDKFYGEDYGLEDEPDGMGGGGGGGGSFAFDAGQMPAWRTG